MNFKDYVLSGRFNKAATEAVADAIARTKARGLPVEGYANTAAAPRAPLRGVVVGKSSAAPIKPQVRGVVVSEPASKDTKKKPLRRRAA